MSKKRYKFLLINKHCFSSSVIKKNKFEHLITSTLNGDLLSSLDRELELLDAEN